MLTRPSRQKQIATLQHYNKRAMRRLESSVGLIEISTPKDVEGREGKAGGADKVRLDINGLIL